MTLVFFSLFDLIFSFNLIFIIFQISTQNSLVDSLFNLQKLIIFEFNWTNCNIKMYNTLRWFSLWLIEIKSFDVRLWQHSNSLTTVLVETLFFFTLTLYAVIVLINNTRVPFAPLSYTDCCVLWLDCIGAPNQPVFIQYTRYTLYIIHDKHCAVWEFLFGY